MFNIYTINHSNKLTQQHNITSNGRKISTPKTQYTLYSVFHPSGTRKMSAK